LVIYTESVFYLGECSETYIMMYSSKKVISVTFLSITMKPLTFVVQDERISLYFIHSTAELQQVNHAGQNHT